jgi:Holliday junction resolvase RusA-like endonuclease
MITVALPYPASILNPNRKSHWKPKAEAKAKAKSDAYFLAMAAGAKSFSAKRVSIGLTIIPPDNRTRDTDNIIASLKSAFDGVSLAIGVDDSRWSFFIERKPASHPGAIILEIGGIA